MQTEQEERVKLSNSRSQSGSKPLAANGRMSSLTRNAADSCGRARSSRAAKSQSHITDCLEDDSAVRLKWLFIVKIRI